MNRAQQKRILAAARAAGAKVPSFRLYTTLVDCARKGGTHCANNSSAAFELETKGWARIDRYPFAVATEAGHAELHRIYAAALASGATTL